MVRCPRKKVVKSPLRRHFERFYRPVSDRQWLRERRLLGIQDEGECGEDDLIALEGLAWLRACRQRAKRGADLAIDAYYLGCALRALQFGQAKGSDIKEALELAFEPAPSRVTLYRWGLRCDRWYSQDEAMAFLSKAFGGNRRLRQVQTTVQYIQQAA